MRFNANDVELSGHGFEPNPADATNGVTRWSDTQRAEGLSDAVFAIVISLLVLDLAPQTLSAGRFDDEVLAHWPMYFAYFTAFLLVGTTWQHHRAVFNHIRYMDRQLH